MSDEYRAVLVATGLSKRFTTGTRQVQALEDVSFAIKPGVVSGLIGPDGAGKTTLMRLAAGLLLQETGRLEVLGMNVASEPLELHTAIGYMPQRFGLYDDLTVEENLELYADLQQVDPKVRPARYGELLEMTALAPYTKRLAGNLSGGMKQKLGLACTLVRSPRLLLLDEPTVGVDPVSRRELWSIVYRLVREASMSVLLSTAYLDEAERCAQVILLHQGRIIGQGAPVDFSAPLQGRTFHIKVPQAQRRSLQSRIASLPGVLDATLQGDRIRLVTREECAPDLTPIGLQASNLTRVAPRFEDGFIARLLDEKPLHTENDVIHKHRQNGEDPIIVEGLTRRFGDFVAVRDLSFRVGSGEVFGLLGANGAGKTTTFRMLCGLLPVTDGRLHVAGKDLRRAPAQARGRIGYMSQKFSLYGNLTVRQNINFFANVYGLRGMKRRERIDWALEDLGLSDYTDSQSAELPLGYKQRLSLACAMMHEPDILFLDEPTSGMDPLARREFWARINRLAQAGVTVLITTHFMEEAEYCDRIAIMALGEFLALDTPKEIKREQGGAPTLEEAFLRLVEGRTAV